MDIYLAGTYCWGICVNPYLKEKTDIAILESFYYANSLTIKEIHTTSRFLLDSGAFTFMNSAKKKVDWNDYTDKYIDFINRHKVSRFFELDLDSIIGYTKVLKLRNRLEQGTGRKCIPVWHKSRGKSEFLKMCDNYDYVAIGGIVSKEIMPEEYKYIPWFINEAHKRNTKIHGLGFTKTPLLKKYHFDSVDSTTWTSAAQFGEIQHFDRAK